MAGIGNLAKVILTFVFFYCFKFSVCCHFCYFGQCSSYIVICLTRPVSTIPVEPISCPLSKILSVLSDLMFFFLMFILSLSTQVNEVQRRFRAENVTSRPLRVI